MLSDITADMVLVDLGNGTAVEYSRALLEEVRRLAVTGFVAFGRGGLEIGGVLYGLRNENRLTIHAFAELACEHARGPAFVLSGKDRQALLEMLHPPSGLQTLGWYRTHTRRGLELDESDRELFAAFPPDASAIGLVLKPVRWGPSTAAFYLRGANGVILTESPREFVVEPPAQSLEQAAKLEPEPEPVAPFAGHEPDMVSAFQPGPWETAARPVKRRWPIAAGVAAALLVAALVGYYRTMPPASLGLQAYAIAPGQVRIAWNHDSRPALQGASGVLEIRDGDGDTKIPLNPLQLRQSSITYIQKSGRIEVSLRVAQRREGADPAEESIEFLGPPATVSAASIPVAEVGVVDDPPTIPAPARSRTAAGPDAQPREEQRSLDDRSHADRADRERASGNKGPIDQPVEATLEPPKPKFQPAALVKENQATATPILPAAPAAAPGPPLQSAVLNMIPNITTVPRPAAQPKAVTTPKSGRLIWTGNLGRHGLLEIRGGRANIGTVSGYLSGTPARFVIDPAEFTKDGLVIYTMDGAANGRMEAPSQANGWNPVEYAFDPVRVGQLQVLEAPNRGNNFDRIVVRSESKTCPVIVIDWTAR